MSNSTMDVRPLTGCVGATVNGLDLTKCDNEGFSLLCNALDRHLAVYVPGDTFDRFVLSDLGKRFGPPFLHPIVDNGFDDCPEVLELRREPGDRTVFGGAAWHADVTWLDPPGRISILHALDVPKTGGDTCIASTVAAFAALSPGMKDMLRSLRAVHSYYGPDGEEDPRYTAIHDVVRTHPVTGAEGLYLNRMFVTRFDNMSRADSLPLIDHLCDHMERHDFTCRFRWQDGGTLLWDNRFTLHYPINDIGGERRVMIRTTSLDNG